MHRKVKGFLSLILTIAMVTSTVPAFAEELQEEHPAEEQTAAETAEAAPAETMPAEMMPTEMISIEAELAQEQETEPVEVQTAEETDSAEEQPAEPNTAEAAAEETDSAEGQPAEPNTAEAAAEDPVAEQTQVMPTEEEPVEQNAAETEKEASTADSSADLDALYDSLDESQKKFDVYSGIQPLSEIVDDADIMAKLAFMEEGVTPDSGSLATQEKIIINTLLADRVGDLKFYTWSTWNVWKVDSYGMPKSKIASNASLVYAATVPLFKAAAYLEGKEIGGVSVTQCCKPILEPVWECINYEIPVYNADGIDTGTTVTVNANNYNDVSFPADVRADSWKLVYDGTEYSLDAASEIWTKGIRVIGEDLYPSKIRLQAVVSETALKEGNAEFTQPDWYEGEPKAEPIVSSETNGTEHITYFYKEAGADDSAYTTMAPTQAGAYTAAAVFAATEEYQEVIRFCDFQILPKLPETPILKEGTAEFVQPNWYEGEPKAEPAVSSETNGVEHITYFYKEAGADDSAYTATVPDKAGKYTAAAVFAATEEYQEVIKFCDFQILPSIPAEEPDEEAPIISGVSSGQTYYGEQTVTITDEHLQTVTVNGELMPITDNRAEFTLKPSEDVYKITAADAADNIAVCTVEVLETWVRDGINDNGIKKLRQERMYKLGSGQWTIDGDSTVYSGGVSFYVKGGGEYNFKRK